MRSSVGACGYAALAMIGSLHEDREERRVPEVYVASPLGFAAAMDSYRETIRLALEKVALKVLDPWDDPGQTLEKAFQKADALPDTDTRRRALARLDMEAGKSNRELLERADAVLAVLDGPDVDSGTAAEIGFAAAGGTPVVGLRTDKRQAGENDGCMVNLQVEYFIRLNGGEAFRDLDDAVSCVRRLARRRLRVRLAES
jgi:nucleoside 2-deoxyribosyltransferase